MIYPRIDEELEGIIRENVERRLTGEIDSQLAIDLAWTLLWRAATVWQELGFAMGENPAAGEAEFLAQAAHAYRKLAPFRPAGAKA